MVTFPRTIPFVLLFASCTSVAEEGTVLIDTSKGIDNTQDSAVTEIKQLSESLNEAATAEVDKIETEPLENESPAVNVEKKSTESVASDNPPISSKSTVLIDKASGIDNTLGTESQSTKSVTEPIKKTTSEEPVINTETEPALLAKPVEAAEKALVKSPSVTASPENKIISKPVTTLPKITPMIFETKEQISTTINRWTPKDNDLRILEIRVTPYKLEDVISAYKYEDVVLIPIGSLSELLDIAITVEPGFARGFVYKEDWTFLLDTSRAEVILKGKPQAYDRSLVHELDDDIYIESDLLSKWLLMTMDIDLYSSRLWITSKEKLPFIKRLEREQRIAKSLARLNRAKETYPKHHESYKNWSIPFVDQTITAGLIKDRNGNTDLTYNYTTNVSADLLKHESTWYMSGNDDETVDDFRATLARHDEEAELLGFMKARKYAVGNVPEPRLNLITTSNSLEPGVAVSNYPLGRQIEYDKRRFRGRLLPGWEVELYQNNALIAYQASPVEGLYDFVDIPLLFGNNHFRLVFYGPQGQIREENEHYNVNQSLTKKGEHYYFATITSDEEGGSRTSTQYDYGISENISSTFTLVSIPLNEGQTRNQHTYTKAGMRGFWDSYLLSLDFIDDNNSGNAIDLSVQTQIDSTIIGFKDTQLSEFFSEEFLPSAVQLSRRSSVNINTAIPSSFLPRIPLDFGIRRDEFELGGNLLEITNRLSINARGYAISNFLTRQTTTSQNTIFNGSMQVSTNINRFNLRGTVNYDLEPDSELTNLSATLDPGQYKDYYLSFGISHSIDQDLTEYSASANKATGKYNLSVGARYNSENEINLDVSFSIGFGYEPRRHQWDSNASTVANQGSVSTRVFLDTNQDGIFGDNDVPLENVGFRLNNGYSASRTAEDGIAFITGLPPYEPLNVVIAPETMIDPLWTMALEGVQVTPRPGHAILLEFPVFMSGEVDGTVYLRKNNKEFGVGKVTVELIDEFDRVLQTAETAYDGFYVMGNVPMGTYRMRVSAKQLDKLALRAKTEETISLSPENLFANGIDFVLLPK